MLATNRLATLSQRRCRIVLLAAAAWLGTIGPANADFEDAVAAYKDGDYAAAAAEFERLAVAGSPAAMNNLGLMYARGQGVRQDFVAARTWYAKAVDLGYPAAMNNLGVMYESGQGVAADDTQAAQWYERAAATGYADAQFNLAALYESGHGVGQDAVQAYMWYSLAAAQGDADAANARDHLKTTMTGDQLKLAQKKLAKWQPQG